MTYMNYEYTDYLYHYGVKGMKWGIRRTAEQLGHKIKEAGERRKQKRQERNEKKIAKAQAKQSKRQAKQDKKNAKEQERRDKFEQEKQMDAETKKQKILSSRNPKLLYENADLFTTQELQNAYNRLVLEKNISNMIPSETSKGKQLVDKYIAAGNTVSDVLATTNKIVSNAQRFKDLTTKGSKDSKPENKKVTTKASSVADNPATQAGKKIVDDFVKDFSKDFTDFNDFMTTQTAQHFSEEGKKYYRDRYMNRK